MRLLTTLTLLLISSISYGQGIWNQVNGNSKFWRLKADSVLIVPRDTSSTNGAYYLGAPVGDGGRLGFYHGRFYGRDNTKFRSFAFVDEITSISDSLAAQNLQNVTNKGNSTTNIILANGGIGTTNSTLNIAQNSANILLRLPRFVDLIGNSTGTANGAFMNFRRSDGSRTGAIGDGSSLDNNIYLSGFDSNRIVVSMITVDTPLATSKLPAQFLVSGQSVFNYPDFSYTPPSTVSMSIFGNAEVRNTIGLSSQVEFKRSTSNFGGSVGYLGNPEMNLSANMDYTDQVHRYYDNTRAALWLALAPGSGDAGAWAIQYAPSGLAADIWTNSPFPYYIRQDRNELRIYNKLRVDSGYLGMQPANQYRWRLRRTDQIQGLEFNVGSGRWKMNNYDSANSVYPNYEFLSTKGTDTRTIAFMHGNNSSMSIGQNSTATPTATLQVAGSLSLPFTSISTNTTLDATHGTVKATASGITITFPAANTCAGRIYRIINYNTGGVINTSAWLSPLAVSTTTIVTGTVVIVQSDGTNWYQINNL